MLPRAASFIAIQPLIPSWPPILHLATVLTKFLLDKMAGVPASTAVNGVNGSSSSVNTSKLSKGQLKKLKAKQKKEQEEQPQPGAANGAAAGTSQGDGQAAAAGVPSTNGSAASSLVKLEDGQAASATASNGGNGNMYDDMVDEDEVRRALRLDHPEQRLIGLRFAEEAIDIGTFGS